ncbi:MAG TPA: DnaA/Hda family protein, partial [Longimicrobiales bacterium]|nr:DnaA/Hda family protein [Longimicrobiales bacterium]
MELTAPELWSRILERARASVPEHAFHTWIASAKAVASTSDELIIEAQNPFHVEWLEDKYGPLLRAAGERILGRPLHITVTCSPEPHPIPLPSIDLPRPPSPAVAAPPASAPPPPPADHSRRGLLLNERYTFDRFIVGANNQLAVAACSAVADQPARMYNPLFLYGGVGLGKTHLMHAIAHQLLANDPDRRISYISSEQFTNELIQSIREGATAAFRSRYREMDLLLVDDTHFLQGKESTQEEFFHTFNALYDAQRQI